MCGVVYHYGSLHGGHYTAACLNDEDECWYKYNDSCVSKIHNPQQELVTSNALNLVYKRRGIADKLLNDLRPRNHDLDLKEFPYQKNIVLDAYTRETDFQAIICEEKPNKTI